MISIVMAYHNRYHLLDKTLKSMTLSSHKDFEVIVVNDFSDEEHSLYSLVNKYSTLRIKIVNMEDLGDRWYINPCVVYNAGFTQVSGDKIIIQNPECMHIGDVISYVDTYLTDNNYLTFECYASSKAQLDYIDSDWDRFYREVQACKVGLTKERQELAWCNHYTYFRRALNFTNAITRNNLSKLNGFDEVMAHGIGGDDNEFRDRVFKLPIQVQFVKNPWTVHQWHEKTLTSVDALSKYKSNEELLRKPRNLRAYNDGRTVI